MFVYSRYGNPTVKMFEQRLALLEGAESCRATGSGMAAQSETAAKISDRLFQHPKIKKISYPEHASHPQHDLAKQQMSGFGSLLAFDVLGGESAAFILLNNLHLIDI